MFKEFSKFVEEEGLRSNRNKFEGIRDQWGEFYVALDILHSEKSPDQQKQLFKAFMDKLKQDLK